MPPKQHQRNRRGTKRKKTSTSLSSSSNAAAVAAPPEELIGGDRRQEILHVYQRTLERAKKDNDGDDDHDVVTDMLPLSYVKKALKKLELEGIEVDEIQRYFGGSGNDNDDDDDDNFVEELDADMFLRFAAAMTLQKERSDRAFQLMDGGGKGLVLIEDLQRVAADLGEDLSEEDLQEMVDFVDSSGEGLLSPKDFFKIARQVRL